MDFQALRLEFKIKVRALSAKVEIEGRLTGSSQLWINLRVTDSTNIQPNRPVVIIKKQVETQRLFCVYGHLKKFVQTTGNDSESEEIETFNLIKDKPQESNFTYFKTQEIPSFSYDCESGTFSKSAS